MSDFSQYGPLGAIVVTMAGVIVWLVKRMDRPDPHMTFFEKYLDASLTAISGLDQKHGKLDDRLDQIGNDIAAIKTALLRRRDGDG